MPINLTKHSKIWIHPDGSIPDKILNRLIFQREMRPDDTLTFFVNQKCINESDDKIAQLKEHGIKIKIIEECLSEKLDDEYHIELAKKIMANVAETKNVRISVFATDVLRFMKVVQQEGVYSDNDVLFLNFNNDSLLAKPYLFGCHKHGQPDIHILGIDLNYSETFYKELIVAMKEVCGDPPYEHEEVTPIAGFAFIPESINLTTYGHLKFPETKDNIISGKDNSHDGGEENLHSINAEDLVLKEAREALEKRSDNQYKV